MCDYMEKCQYTCTPHKDIIDTEINSDSYTEPFIMKTTEKIIQRIKDLFKESFVFEKKQLISHINIVRKYPLSQINASLQQLIEDKSEYISDKYGRLGNVINIGNLYLFQPLELKQERISTFERSIPIPYKREYLEMPQNIISPRKNDDPDRIDDKTYANKVKSLFEKIQQQYTTGTETELIKRGETDWFVYCSVTIKIMQKIGISSEKLLSLLTAHIVENLTAEEIIILLNELDSSHGLPPQLKLFIQEYFEKLYLVGDESTGLLIHNYSKTPPRSLLVKKHHDEIKQWSEGTPADMYKLQHTIKSNIIDVQHKNKKRFNKYVGYLSKFKKEEDMIFKVKDNSNMRNKGARCDQSSKGNATIVLQEIFSAADIAEHYVYFENATRTHLCVVQELYLRYLNSIKENKNIWFVTPLEANMQEFDK